MNKEFVVKLEDEYIDLVKKNKNVEPKIKEQFLELLTLKDLKKRFEYWQNLLAKIEDSNILKELANPLFIGYGNIDSKVLILGKEKGFNIDEYPNLFLIESINNLLQWRLIAEGKEEKLLDFDPIFPNKYHKKKKENHTWAKCAKIITGVYKADLEYPCSFTAHKDLGKSFFSKCFMTELNYLPSAYSEIDPWQNKFVAIRSKLLKEDLIPKFKVVLVGAKTYFSSSKKKKQEQLENIFGEYEFENEGMLGVSKKGNPRLPYEIYKVEGGKRYFILVNQLSGGAAWDTGSLEKLSEKIKNLL